jgi:16S rRNA processing protein RimM
LSLENGDKYGEVISVSNNGKQDLLRIKMSNNKETLIVFVNALIKEVDIKNKSIILNDIEGL